MICHWSCNKSHLQPLNMLLIKIIGSTNKTNKSNLLFQSIELNMRWILAFHIIFMVAWFAGLFYLPRLYIYHTLCTDEAGNARFKVMERKLFWMIMTPAGVLTSVFGLWLLVFHWEMYSHLWWMHIKLICVMLLWAYHLFCGYLLYQFRFDRNQFPPGFYRVFNEVPTVFLMVIVVMAIVRP